VFLCTSSKYLLLNTRKVSTQTLVNAYSFSSLQWHNCFNRYWVINLLTVCFITKKLFSFNYLVFMACKQNCWLVFFIIDVITTFSYSLRNVFLAKSKLRELLVWKQSKSNCLESKFKTKVWNKILSPKVRLDHG
jgi:hypothetical protein